MKKSLGSKSLVYPTPVWVIGAYDKEGKPNIMTVAWGGICSSKPPSIAISLRGATYTHGCIIERRAFTVNVPSESQVGVVDYIGIVSGRNINKFSETGLTAVKSEIVDAPYVEEFSLILECRLTTFYDVGIHTHFIGEIMDVKADESALGENGVPDIRKVLPILYAPELKYYYGVGGILGKAFSIGKKV